MEIAAERTSRAGFRTLAVIPARLGATRLPRKPLRLLGGRPLIVQVWDRVRQLDVVSTCVVATDSTEVADAVHAAGGLVELTSADHPSGTDRVAEVAGRPAYRDFAAVVNVQGDEPYVAAAAVEGALANVTVAGFPLGTAAAPMAEGRMHDPNIVKVVTADDDRAMYFSRAPIPYLRDASDGEVLRGRVLQHIGVYAYTRDALACWVALPTHAIERIERLEQLRPLAAGLAMGVARIAGPVAGGIDTEDDLRRADAAWPRLPTDET